MGIRKRNFVIGMIALTIGLMTASCTHQAETTETTPPPPSRDSPQSPVRAVNARMADKANLGAGGAISTKKRTRER